MFVQLATVTVRVKPPPLSVLHLAGATLAQNVLLLCPMAKIAEIRSIQATKLENLYTRVDTGQQRCEPEDRPFHITERPDGVYVGCNLCKQQIAFFDNYRTACFEAHRWATHLCPAIIRV